MNLTTNREAAIKELSNLRDNALEKAHEIESLCFSDSDNIEKHIEDYNKTMKEIKSYNRRLYFLMK